MTVKPINGFMTGTGLFAVVGAVLAAAILVSRYLQEDGAKTAAIEAAATIKQLRSAGCRLVEIDLSRQSAFDCHGVRIWHDRTVTAAWQTGTSGEAP